MPDEVRHGVLAGRRVVVLRPEGRGAGLAERLCALGADVQLAAAIAFEPPDDPAEADCAVVRLREYAWIVVTSPTGARCLAQRARKLAKSVPETARVAAVGPGTARALQGEGIDVSVVAERADAEGLAHALVGHVCASDRVLVVRPEIARDALPEALRAAGARVDAVAFYRTVPAPGARSAAREILRGACDAVVFSSPSTLHAVLDALGDARPAVLAGLAKIGRVAIGTVTARALDGAGAPAHVIAASPDDEAVAEAVARLWYDPGFVSGHETTPPTRSPVGGTEGDR